jgi:hypothetical protein
MKRFPASTPDGLPRRSVLGLMLGTVISACGGGGSQVAGVSSGGTGSFTSGSIIGFGSIIVNGVRYEDVNAQVLDVDGTDRTNSNALKLGMVVAVEGSPTTAVQTGFNYSAEGTASKVVFVTELQGPVSELNPAAQSFAVLGQPVRWTSTTLFEVNASGATLPSRASSDLANGQYAEVYGLWDAETQTWQATRVEASTSAPSVYRLSAEVEAIDTTRRLITAGGQRISWAGLSLDPAVTQGSRVRASLNPVPQSDGSWVAQSLRLADWRALPSLSESAFEVDEVELEGIVSGVSGTRFWLQGFEVDGSRLQPMVSNGQRVEVKGSFSQGVVVATRWELEGDDEREAKGFELHGVVSAFSPSAMQFELRGYTIAYDGLTQGAGVLADGVGIEAKLQLGSDGSWYAREIERDDDASASGSGNDDDGEEDDDDDHDDD